MLLSKKTLFVHIMPCTKEMFVNMPEKSRGRRGHTGNRKPITWGSTN